MLSSCLMRLERMLGRVRAADMSRAPGVGAGADAAGLCTFATALQNTCA
jgi:hypothetical protein